MLKITAKQKVVQAVEQLNAPVSNSSLSASLQSNLDMFKALFQDDDTALFRTVQGGVNGQYAFGLLYCDGLVNSAIMDEHILKPLMEIEDGVPITIDTVMSRVVRINEAKKTTNVGDIIKSVTYGDTILFIDGVAEGILLNTKGFTLRSIAEPEGEKVLNGPREGFTEGIMMNLSLLHRKVRSNELKMKFQSMGTRTQTQVCVVYIDSLVNKRVLQELQKRLSRINMDAVLDENYLSEQIRDNALSPFRTTGLTERPDVVAGRLLEGRIAVLVDGSPTVMTVPYLFIENFQSNEDYYMSFFYTSFSRMLRIMAFFLTVSIPAIYTVIITYHHEILPTALMMSISAERQSVPLPVPLEAFALLLMFDILRETGIRMPSSIGQALSVVGALVVGQAAVEAKLVSASMIIMVAITGITGLIIPKMNAPIIFVRLGLLLAASSLGFLGLGLGFSMVLIHVLNLKSFGIAQITPDKHLSFQDIKDTYIRAPWWKMRTRPKQLSEDTTRLVAEDRHE